MKITTTPRFEIKKKLGEGSFANIYEAWDSVLKQNIALKVEKEAKQNVLKFEYEILKRLQKVDSVPRIYDLIGSNESKFIAMELLGLNVGQYKKDCKCSVLQSLDIATQMLDSIEKVHEAGYIHRDIKPTNFVMGKGKPDRLYIIDFGLSKLHLDKHGKPLPIRKQTDFRGTLTYASVNAHNKSELSRRDDLWSFLFSIMELLDFNLPWRGNLSKASIPRDEIRDIKLLCLERPEFLLVGSNGKCKDELLRIVRYLSTLSYESKPDYGLIRTYLESMKIKELYDLNFNKLLFPAQDNTNSIPIENDMLLGQKRSREGGLKDQGEADILSQIDLNFFSLPKQETNLEGLALLMNLVSKSSNIPYNNSNETTNQEDVIDLNPKNSLILIETIRSQNRNTIKDIFNKSNQSNLEKNLLFQVLSNDKESLNNLINDLFQADGEYSFVSVMKKNIQGISNESGRGKAAGLNARSKREAPIHNFLGNGKISSMSQIFEANPFNSIKCNAPGDLVDKQSRDFAVLGNMARQNERKPFFMVERYRK